MEHQDPNHRHRHQQNNRSQEPNHRHNNVNRARAAQQNRRPTPEKDDITEFATISTEGFTNMKPTGFKDSMQGQSDYINQVRQQREDFYDNYSIENVTGIKKSMSFADDMKAKSDYYKEHAVGFGNSNPTVQLKNDPTKTEKKENSDSHLLKPVLPNNKADATKHNAGSEAAKKFEYANIPVTEKKPNSIERSFNAVGNMAKTVGAGASLIPQGIYTEYVRDFKGPEERAKIPWRLPEVNTSEGAVKFGSAEHTDIFTQDAQQIGNDVLDVSKIAAAGAVGEVIAGATALSPYVSAFVGDALTSGVGQSINRFQETGSISFKIGEIDLANSFIKACFTSKFGASNKVYQSVKPALEEALKVVFDVSLDAGVEELKPLNELLGEFGVRMAFKKIKTNTKDQSGRKLLPSDLEFLLESTKKATRSKTVENLNDLTSTSDE